MSDTTDLVATVDAVACAFAQLGIGYFITGSIASSVHGEFRATNDIDVVAALEERQLAPLVDALAGDFAADVDQARDALRSNTSFNLIHRATFLKVDIFPCVSAFEQEAVRRAEVMTLAGGVEPLRVATLEDILLAKLRWYRLGDETSEVQRRDIQSLILLNSGELDQSYLRYWAGELGVADLLVGFLKQPE